MESLLDGKNLTVRQTLEKMFVGMGLFETQAVEIVKIAIPKISVTEAVIHWDGINDYPDLLTKVFFKRCWPYAFEWAEKNMPKAWWKPMFEPKGLPKEIQNAVDANMTKVERSLKETETIISYVSTKTKETIKEIRESQQFRNSFEFTVTSDNPRKFEIFIKGDRTAGTTYQLINWKTIPVVKIESHKNYPTHPTAPGECFVSFICMGGGFSDSNEKTLEYTKDGYFDKYIKNAILTAIDDYTEQNTL
jgi:hypothetical protein